MHHLSLWSTKGIIIFVSVLQYDFIVLVLGISSYTKTTFHQINFSFYYKRSLELTIDL